MTIVARDDAGGTVFAVEDCFDASQADALQDVLARVDPDRVVTVDFRAARRIEDFAVARLARDLASRPLLLVGLSEHHHRILRYVQPGSDAGSPSHPVPGRGGECKQSGVPLVLVVGDDRDVRELLAEFLATEGYDVHEAADPGDVMRHTAEHRPSAVLLDFAMPGGWLILQRLRAEPATTGVPVVVISESLAPPEGACAAVREPFELGALAATLAGVRSRTVN